VDQKSNVLENRAYSLDYPQIPDAHVWISPLHHLTVIFFAILEIFIQVSGLVCYNKCLGFHPGIESGVDIELVDRRSPNSFAFVAIDLFQAFETSQ